MHGYRHLYRAECIALPSDRLRLDAWMHRYSECLLDLHQSGHMPWPGLQLEHQQQLVYGYSDRM
jgi:hypothetical protein